MAVPVTFVVVFPSKVIVPVLWLKSPATVKFPEMEASGRVIVSPAFIVTLLKS